MNASPYLDVRVAARSEDTNAGSAWVVAALRCDARGAAMAAGSDIPRSMWLTRICRTVVMIVAPPGEPTAKSNRPFLRTIVGDMLERGRLPAAGRFGSGRPTGAAVKSKSVISLLSRKP